MEPGTRVRFLSDALGVIDPSQPGMKFTEHVVSNGDEGAVLAATMPDGWLAVEPDNHPNMYVPVHPSMIARVD